MVGPNTAAALKEWLAAPRADLEPATMARVENMISRLSLATKERAVSKHEADERLNLYWRALSDLPLIDLAAAYDKILKTSTFMPTPAEIRSHATLHGARRNFLLSRARHLVWLHETQFIPPIPESERLSPDDLKTIVAAAEAKFPSKRDAA